MVFDKVKTIISEQLGIDESEVTLLSTFEELGIDSLEIFEIVMTLEDEFDLQISNEDAEKMKSVEDVVKYIHEKMH